MTTTRVEDRASATFVMVSVEASLQGDDMPFQASLLCLAPSGARGLCAHVVGHVGGGEAELIDGSGEEVEGAEGNAAP